MIIQTNKSLKDYNSFKVDVKAEFFAEINSVENIQQIILDGLLTDHSYLIIGSGCNMLFSEDFEGLILKINNKGTELIKETDSYAYVKVAAGEDWDNFIIWSIEHDYYGLENLSMIPGSVGASPVQNIGAYGVELKDVFYELEAINLETGGIKVFSKNECKFGYRDSIFKHQLKNKFIILSVTFRLRKRASFKCDYEDLRLELKNKGITNLTAKIVREVVCSIRLRKLPYPSELGNAGSFFKNPVINEFKFTELKKRYSELKYYELPGNKYKLPAAWMIEKCGWKGRRIGNVGVHKDQALVIVNYGNATGEEIIKFADSLMDDVIGKFGVLLDFEVNII